MPEGPSIVILKEKVKPFIGRKVILATGNTKKININRIENLVIKDFKSWGKHFLICFETYSLKIHFLLFGTYRINERKETDVRLSLKFKKGEINFYTCIITEIEDNLDEVYDWSADVMNENWNKKAAKKKLKLKPEMMVCDALLDQQIFSGVGNIIKNEVLYRCYIHPETKIKDLPLKKLNELLTEAVNYSFDFLEWKKEFSLKKHFLIYNQKLCKRCNLLTHKENLGKSNRKTIWCSNCQKLY